MIKGGSVQVITVSQKPLTKKVTHTIQIDDTIGLTLILVLDKLFFFYGWYSPPNLLPLTSNSTGSKQVDDVHVVSEVTENFQL